MNRAIPQTGDIFRHFKNRYYRVISIAEHTETKEKLVIYKRYEYTLSTIYARPLDMFMSKIDKNKYPHATDIYRFTLVPKTMPLNPIFLEQ